MARTATPPAPQSGESSDAAPKKPRRSAKRAAAAGVVREPGIDVIVDKAPRGSKRKNATVPVNSVAVSEAAPVSVTAARQRRTMRPDHREALATGRSEGRIVRDYLEALEAHRPKRGRKRTTESIGNRLNAIGQALDGANGVDRVHLLQEQADLGNELDSMSAESNLPELEAAFVTVAANYGHRKGISYETWRKIGVAVSTLRSAEISR